MSEQSFDEAAEPSTTRFTLERQGNAIVVHTEGEIDALTAPKLRGLIDEASREPSSSPARIVVDLQGATFIDSMGLGAIIQARRDAEKLGRQVVLARAHGIIRQLIQVTHLTRVVRCYDTLEEAVEAVNSTVENNSPSSS